MGNLGLIGRNGWYCLESEVERWPALAGWRGLKDPAVQEHFDNTARACSRAWPDAARLIL